MKRLRHTSIAGRTVCVGAALLASAVATSPQTALANQAPGVPPFVPTPPAVVDAMLELAQVTEDDVVYDLGCGDGRIVIAAAKRYGARGVGIDIDPDLIEKANTNAQREGVEHLVTFVQQDVLHADVSDATVVTLYLLPAFNLKLRPILTSQLRAGARIVSHNFDMGDWEPDRVDSLEDAISFSRSIFLWRFDGQYRP